MNRIQFVVMMLAALSLCACASANKNTSASGTPANHGPHTAAHQASMSSHAASTLAKISCSKGKDTRLLEIAKKGPGCTLNYTKFGKTHSVASSIHGYNHCDQSQKKIRKILEHAGFKCA